jgi:hypothetical protein
MRQGSFNHTDPLSSSRRPIVGSLRVPFGLKAGRMWSPKQVASGLQCGCICPACQAPLVAKAVDSEHRRPHFAHVAETDCRAGYETALHKKAKQLLIDHAALLLPTWDGEEDMPNAPVLADDEGRWWSGARVEFPRRQVRLQNVRLEEAQGDYTPDVIAADDQAELLIEIRVSHAVDLLKRRRIQAEGKRLVEIDLSALAPDALHDEDRLIHAVLYEPSNRYWLSCPEATEAWRHAYRNLKARVAQRNQEIALERQRLEEVRLAQLRTAEEAQAQRMAQQENRARFQEQQRAPYLELLEELPALVSVSRIETLLADYQIRDGGDAERLTSQIPSSEVQKAVRYCGPNAWIYLVHPSLWQAASYYQFVLGQPAGAQFNQRELAQWVMQQFGREEGLYALFRAQYKFRSKVRSAGIRKNRISFWAFTDLENQQIPDFYKPINAFVDRLIYVGVLDRVPGILGQVRIPASRCE